VRVTLSATAVSSSEPVLYAWDLNNDGTADTPPSENPATRLTMPDSSFRRVQVIATNPDGDQATDTVPVASRRCGQ
jgi:hypothetical protein